jgi:hypothetical protein
LALAPTSWQESHCQDEPSLEITWNISMLTGDT